MARWHGMAGFVVTDEVEPGVWEPRTIKRPYYGDVLSNSRRWNQKQDSSNDDISLSNQISIVCDSFAMENWACLKWVEYGGAKWKVTSVDVAFPRLVLSFGGVYAETES